MLYPLQVFIVLQDHLRKMYGDRGPRVRRKHGEFLRRELTTARGAQAHLPGWESKGLAVEFRIFQMWKGLWDSLLLLRGPDPPP